jgi:hypothetical protein
VTREPSRRAVIRVVIEDHVVRSEQVADARAKRREARGDIAGRRIARTEGELEIGVEVQDPGAGLTRRLRP